MSLLRLVAPSMDLSDQPTSDTLDTSISTNEWICHACHPPRNFAHKKTLAKHVRSLHGGSRYTCPHCEQVFARKDNRDRHEAEQHTGLAKYVTCTPCNKRILLRAFDDHVRSQQHLRAEEDADRAMCNDIRAVETLLSSSRMSTDSFIDPFLALSWCWGEANAFGTGLDTAIQTSSSIPAINELRSLLCLGLRVLKRQLLHVQLSQRSQQQQLQWSIAALTIVTALVDGWDAAQPHLRALAYLLPTASVLDTGQDEKVLMWPDLTVWKKGYRAEDVHDLFDSCYLGLAGRCHRHTGPFQLVEPWQRYSMPHDYSSPRLCEAIDSCIASDFWTEEADTHGRLNSHEDPSGSEDSSWRFEVLTD